MAQAAAPEEAPEPVGVEGARAEPVAQAALAVVAAARVGPVEPALVAAAVVQVAPEPVALAEVLVAAQPGVAVQAAAIAAAIRAATTTTIL